VTSRKPWLGFSTCLLHVPPGTIHRSDLEVPAQAWPRDPLRTAQKSPCRLVFPKGQACSIRGWCLGLFLAVGLRRSLKDDTSPLLPPGATPDQPLSYSPPPPKTLTVPSVRFASNPPKTTFFCVDLSYLFSLSFPPLFPPLTPPQRAQHIEAVDGRGWMMFSGPRFLRGSIEGDCSPTRSLARWSFS